MLKLCICAEYFDVFKHIICNYQKKCSKSILKHSVVHFQGIGMKFRRFIFKIVLSKYVEKWDFEKVWIRAWQGLDKGWIKVLEWDIFVLLLFFPFFFHLFSCFCVFSFAFFLLLIFCFLFCFLCFFFFFFFSTLGLDWVLFCFFVFSNWGLGWVLFFLVHFIFLSFYRSCL